MGATRLADLRRNSFNARLFAFFNTNKRGITLDLDTPTDQDSLRRLVSGAVVLTESFRPNITDLLAQLGELDPVTTPIPDTAADEHLRL